MVSPFYKHEPLPDINLMAHTTRIQQLLTSLRESIIDKPPYISGTLQLPDSRFSLFYQATEDQPRRINLASATPDELEMLSQACEPASFGTKQQNVLDETYRKAGKMDSKNFAPTLDLFQTDMMKIVRDYLLEGTQSTMGMKAELYKLNVYGKGSFFKPHVDTPRSDKMFGSLVIVFPTPHEGGALHLRHRGQEWTFDSSMALAAEGQLSIGYVAFFSDIEHEVTPVTSGHRVTLTYNLYFEDDGDVSASDAISGPPTLPNKGAFHEAFMALLDNPEFLADGGVLAFGLRHVYPIKNDLKHVSSVLKGSDTVVYKSLRALGYEPVLYLHYDCGYAGAIIDKVIDFPKWQCEDDVDGILYESGGFTVIKEDDDSESICEEDIRFARPERVDWVTPVMEFNRRKDAFLHYGNEPSLRWAYGDVCLVVRIGKAGERLAYPTAAELKKARSRVEWDDEAEDDDDDDDDDEEI